MENEIIEAGFRQLEVVPVIGKVKKLQVDRRYRDRKGLFFVEGIRNFVEAVDHGYSIETLIYSERLLVSPIARKMVRKLKRASVPFARVTPEEFRIFSRTERASGVAAIVRQSVRRLEQIKPDDQICWIALSDIRSVGNLGTLFRTAAAVGAAGFILLGNHIDPFDPNLVRASMGAIFKQTIVRTSLDQFRSWIQANNLQVVGAAPSGQVDYDQFSYKPPTILMLGHERSGLTPAQQSICQQLVRIPMSAGMDSLNVGVAGSLLLYEVFRSSRRNS